ncbi:MAG: hypothetical protein RIQ71_1067 [Verrucomicrobiota bacterium]|jgi:hypothetical protein
MKNSLSFIIKSLLYASCVFYVNVSVLAATEVEAEGRAAGDQRTAREQALADALREAVRVGVGVDVLSSSGVSDFALDYDRILSSAFGHVKTYKILSSGLGEDQIYRIKVKATVEAGAPDAKNTLALRQIVQLKGAPRVSINVEEEIDGAPGETKYAQGIMEQTARELQFNLVDAGTARTYESKLAKRDAILGNERNEKLRSADISQKSDFLIEGRIVARYVGQQSIYGSLPQHVFSVGGELRAIRPETGEIVATAALPGTENVESELESKEMAARDVIQKILASAGKQGGLPPLFSKVIAQWVTETDLGAVKRLEFTGIPNEDFQKIQASLKDTEKVSSVWPREFDSQGISVIDIETRLDNSSIDQEVSKASGGKAAMDRATDNLLAFKYSDKPAEEDKKSGWWPF